MKARCDRSKKSPEPDEREAMSGKYNTQHPMRSNSKYPERLRRRGMNNVNVRMEDVETLRRRQGARTETVVLQDFPAYNGKRNEWRRRDEN